MLEDVLKKAFYTGLGFLTTKKGFKERIDDLVNQGDLTEEEGKKAFAEMEKDFNEKKEEMESNFQQMVRNALDKMDVPSSEKVTALEKRVKSLEIKLGLLSKEVKALKSTGTSGNKTSRKKHK